MKTEFGTAGDIRDVDLLAAFVAFWRERASGMVSFTRGGGSAALALADGEVVSVSSSEPRFEAAAILVRAGKLEATAIERLGVPEGTDAALAALQAGILTKREWRWGEKIRAIEILADLLAWPDGKYYFDADARPQPGEFTLAVPRLILELFLRSRDRHFVEHQLGPTDAPLMRSEEFEREFTTFGLTADAESVVRLIDGSATADDIARAAPADEFAVRKLLAALTTLGLVRAGSVPSEAAADVEEPPAVPEPAILPVAPDLPAMEDWRPETREDASPDDVEAVLPVEESDARYPAESRADDRPRPREREQSATRPLDGYPAGGLADEPLRDREAVDDGRMDAPRSLAYDPMPAREPDAAPEPEGPDGRSGFGKILGWTLAALVVVVAAILYWRSRPITSAGPAGATEGPTPAATFSSTSSTPVSRIAAGLPSTPATTAMSVPTAIAGPLRVSTAPPLAVRASSSTPAVRAAAEAPARRSPSPAALVAARPTLARPTPASPAVARPAAPARVETVHPSGAASGGRAEWAARATRDRRRLDRERATKYAIQLELACEVPSLAEAWKHDRPAGSMWLLESPHAGRPCFRVLWGRYPSIDAARRAKPRIPAFFVTGSNHPAVVGVR